MGSSSTSTVSTNTNSTNKVRKLWSSIRKSSVAERDDHENLVNTKRQRRAKSWYAHMVLIHLSEFGAEAARGLVLPILFTYVQELGGGLEDIGLLTALFSLGKFFSSLLFGWLCDRTSFQVLYNIAGGCAVLGNLMYVLPYSPSVHSRMLLALSRFVIGFGAGNRSVCRANIAMLTRVDQRLQYFTIFATVVYLAYALTPGFSILVGDAQVQVAGDLLQFNRFTAPGFLLVVLNLFTIVFNNLIYDDSISRDDAPESQVIVAAMVSSPNSTKPSVKKLTNLDIDNGKAAGKMTAQALQREAVPPFLSDGAVTVGMLVFIFLNFYVRGILSIFETVNVPLFLEMTNRTTTKEQDSVEATQEASAFYLVVGLFGLISYGSVQALHKRISDVGCLLFSFGMLLAGNAVLLTLSTDMPHVGNERNEDNTNDHSQQQFNAFVAAQVFVWSIGCPLISAVVVSAFSKVLGSRPQGLLMGIFGASASVARMIMPFLPSLLASWPLLFLVNLVLCAICILVLMLYLGFISSQGNKTDDQSRVAYDSVQLHSDGEGPIRLAA